MNNPNAYSLADLLRDTSPDERNAPLKIATAQGDVIVTGRIVYTITQDESGKQTWAVVPGERLDA